MVAIVWRVVVIISVLLQLVFASGCASRKETKIAEDMVDAMARGDYASATKNIDGNVKGLLSEDWLRHGWNEVVGKSGSFIRRTGTRQETIDGHRIVYVTCKFEKFVWDVSVRVTDNETIDKVHYNANSFQNASYTQPSYVNEDRFVERTIIVNYQKWQLHGMLTLPVTDEPCPVVILVPESSLRDRDNAYNMNRPYQDIAWGLASQGIAVLRYDGLTSYPDNLKTIGVLTDNWTAKDEVTGVVDTAIALCQQRKEIDKEHIYVLGHGQSGYLLPRIGRMHSDIAGLILSAANARRPEDALLSEVIYKLQASERVLSVDANALVANIKKTRTEISTLTPSSDKSKRILGQPVSYWLDLKGYDAAVMAKTLKQPMLVLQTGRDFQTTEADNEIWNKALGSKPSVKIVKYPKLNHIYIQGEGQITQIEYVMPGNVSGEVVNDIAGWIHNHR